MPRLRTYVHLTDEEGQAVVFGPSSDVPQWAVEKITNPDCWAEEEALPEPEPEPEPEDVEEPPRGGPKASKAVWLKFAAAKGVEVPDSASRDDIVAACVAAGVIEE